MTRSKNSKARQAASQLVRGAFRKISFFSLLSILSQAGYAQTANDALADAQASTLYYPSDFYFWVVGIWLAVVILFLAVMITKFTCRNWPADCPNPYQEETLGMPPGVLRSLLTLSLVVFIFLIELYRFQYPFALEEFSKLLIQGFEIMLGFYFGTKALQTLSNNETKSKKSAVEAAAGMPHQIPPTNKFEDKDANG